MPDRLRGTAAAALALLSLLHYLQPPSAWLRRGVVHVAPDGFDGYLGPSRRFAVRTLARAARIAGPGETILLWPGIYRESVRLRRGGRPGHPLVLRAAVPGQAVISGAAAPEAMASWRWRWRPEGRHLWSTAAAWRVEALRWRGVRAYRSSSPQHLRAICARPGAWPAFHASSDRLWLCLPKGEAPLAAGLELTRPMPQRRRSGGHQVAAVWIEAPHVLVRDLRFSLMPMAAIQLWNTDHVQIEANLFEDADVAVNDSPALRAPAAVRISRNLSTCQPLGEWERQGWLSWRERYFYSNCSLLWLHGRDIRVERNVVLQAGDAIKLTPSGGSNVARHNLIVETSDDGFEFDGEARNLTVSDNLILDPFVAFAPSPVSAGPLLIRANTVLIPPLPAGLGYGVLLKLMGGPIRRVTLRANVFVGYRIGNGTADAPLEDVRIAFNRFATVMPRTDGLAQAGQIRWQDNSEQRLSLQQWREALRDPSRVGAQPPPGPPGPAGPAWLDLRRHPAAAPLRPWLDSPWLSGSWLPSAPQATP